MSYPYYLYLNDQLRPDVSVYYNIDDYTLYWPDRAQEIRELERATVLAADVTICVSRLRADELIAAVPEAAGANPPRSPWHADAVPGPAAAHRSRPRPPPTWRACRDRIWATSARSKTGSTGSSWTS